MLAFNSSPAVAHAVTVINVCMDVQSGFKGETRGVPEYTEALVFDSLPYDVLIGSPTLAKLGIGLAVIGAVKASESHDSDQRIVGWEDVEAKFPDVLSTDREPRFTVPFTVDRPVKLVGCKPYRMSAD